MHGANIKIICETFLRRSCHYSKPGGIILTKFYTGGFIHRCVGNHPEFSKTGAIQLAHQVRT